MKKKGKDRTLLENWRPISLFNVDTKIMSKLIASRLKNVLPNIIHHNQTGFIKDGNFTCKIELTTRSVSWRSHLCIIPY